jgi:hypothetical protein
MSVSSERAKRAVKAGAVPVAMVVSGLLVWQASYAAFSSTTQNPGDRWSAGSVELSDDDANTAMFAANGLKPGDQDSACIAVTSDGTLPAEVKLYGEGYTTMKSLGSYVDLVVEEGTGGGFGDCTGFTPLTSGAVVYDGTLEAFGSSHTSHGTGVGSWAPDGSGSETRVYRFGYQLDPATPDSVQGGTAVISFAWEAQSS